MESTEIYISSEQFDQIINALNTLIENQSNIHKVLTGVLIWFIFCGVVWLWTSFIYHILCKPLDDV